MVDAESSLTEKYYIYLLEKSSLLIFLRDPSVSSKLLWFFLAFA